MQQLLGGKAGQFLYLPDYVSVGFPNDESIA
jgi:hypothetical protein